MFLVNSDEKSAAGNVILRSAGASGSFVSCTLALLLRLSERADMESSENPRTETAVSPSLTTLTYPNEKTLCPGVYQQELRRFRR